jgi:hypothetical protein
MDIGAQDYGHSGEGLSGNGTEQSKGADDGRRYKSPPPVSPARGQSFHNGHGRNGTYLDRQTSRHAASRSKTRRIRKLTALVAVLLVALVGTSMGWILAWAKLNMLESENLALDIKLRKTSEELQSLQTQMAERETALQEMVEKRIPGLRPLEYNKLVKVDDKYVMSITFAELGVADSKAIEYHALLRNDTNNIVLPKVRIFLFDDLGIQTGESALKKADATGDVEIAELRAGETRSYNAKIDMERHAVPRFFLVQVD